jgi:AraC family transcriptional regulator
MERHQNIETADSSAAEVPFEYLANSVATLLETARHEFKRDPDSAMASLAKASTILRSGIARHSEAIGSASGGLAGWQIERVRAFIDNNLHRTIHNKELSTVARRSAAHFARSFKKSLGKSPHAFVMAKRLEKACDLMITSSAPLSEIAWSVGFSDQSHLCKRFKQTFGESPSHWRREREIS